MVLRVELANDIKPQQVRRCRKAGFLRGRFGISMTDFSATHACFLVRQERFCKFILHTDAQLDLDRDTEFLGWLISRISQMKSVD